MDEDARLKRWMSTTVTMLKAVDNEFCQPYSICLVPEELRKWKESAYEPKVVSIGHRYKGRRELLPMEETKWRCIMSLLMRTEDEVASLESCMSTTLKLEGALRASYGEEIKLDSYDLATIMVYDGCFLLELLISASQKWNSKLKSRSLSLAPALGVGDVEGKMEAVLKDLILLENQIPYSTLPIFFAKLFPSVAVDAFKIVSDLAESFFGYSRDSSLTLNPVPATHFLELAHLLALGANNYNHRTRSHSNSSVAVVDINKQVKLNRCATRLQAAGVRIKCCKKNSVIPASNHFNIVNIEFSHGILEISPLHVTQTTEPKWRNFIAWEHHKNKRKKRSDDDVGGDMFTFSALLFNDLICCAGDVQMLKNKGIIVIHLNMSNHDVVDLFRSITKGVDRGLVDSSDYSNMIDDLNTYSATNCVVRFPIIAWHYLSRISEWIYGLHKFLRRGYNYAAALITLLTVIQTFYAVLSYHRPN